MKNFGIKEYIHLSLNGAMKDSTLTSSNSSSNLNTYISNLNKLERDFTLKAGVSSQEFLNKLRLEGQSLEALNELFSSSSFLDFFETATNKEVLSSLITSKEDLDTLIETGRTMGYEMMLAKMYTKSGKQIKEDIDRIQNSIGLAAGSTYDVFLGAINSSSTSETQKRNAASYIIVSEAMKSISKSKASIHGKALATGRYNFTENTDLVEIERLLKEIQREYSKDKPSLGRISSMSKEASGRMSKVFQTSGTGEISSLILEKYLLDAIEDDVVKTINTAVNKMSIGKNSSLTDIATAIEKSLNVSTQIEIDVSIPTSNQIISKKMYKDLTATSVTFAENASISSLLSSGEGSNELSRLFSGSGGAQLFNALNFYFLQGSYNVPTIKKGKVIPYRDKNDAMSTARIDALFGNQLSNLMMTILTYAIAPKGVGLIDINGMIIPTPTYYQIMMEKYIGIRDGGRYASSFVQFNRSSGRSAVEKIINSPNAVAQTSKRDSYVAPAYFRNNGVKSAILQQKISVRTPMLSFADYKTAINL